MKFRSFVAAAVVLSMVTSAQAVSLVVINVATNATNSAIPVGEQVVTFGVQVKESDLTGAGLNPVLLVQDLTFAGNGLSGAAGNPFNGATGATNKVDVQSVQSTVIDPVAENNGTPVTAADLTTSAKTALYADSWWYQGGGGTLQGVNDASGNPTTLTNPLWQTGPISYIGATGFQWTPNGATGVQAGATAAAAIGSNGGTNASSGQFMMYSGFYGPNGLNGLTGATLAAQFVNGTLTVPLAQIVTSGDVHIPGDYSNGGGGNPSGPGSGTYIGVIGTGVANGPTGNGTYNIAGGNPTVDPGAFYSFAQQKIIVPEPGSVVLAGLGVLGLAMAWKRRK